MKCPCCSAEVKAGDFSCALCKLALRIEKSAVVPVYPLIRPGEALDAVDLRTSRPIALQAGNFALLNGAIRAEQSPMGLTVNIDAGKAFQWSNPFLRLRDACVRASVVLSTNSALAYLMLRCDEVGIAKNWYGFMVSAQRRAARIVRMISSEQESVYTPLTNWIEHPGIAPVGGRSDLEFYAQGPTLEGRANGQRVIAMHDPILGIGRVGVRFEAEESGAASVTWTGYEAAGVIA